MKLNHILRRFYNLSIAPACNFIFPKSCHVCGVRLEQNAEYICPSCLSKLPRTLFHRMQMNPMEMRFAGKFPFVNATGFFFYTHESEVAILIHDFKYRHFKGLARHLGKQVASELYPSAFFSDVDGIIPIPMHWLKKAQRGYNQTEEIAKGISEVLNLPILNNLIAHKPHKTQTKLSTQQRLSNLSGTFKVINPKELANRHILLLDDVCTTGSTLTTAADTLLAAIPNLRITLLSLAVTTS